MGLVAWAVGGLAVLWFARRLAGRSATAAEAARERRVAGAVHAVGSTWLGSMAGSGPVRFDPPPAVGFEPDGDHVVRVEGGDPPRE
jgi:hypothetical protein